jgi:hypothetical protein
MFRKKRKEKQSCSISSQDCKKILGITKSSESSHLILQDLLRNTYVSYARRMKNSHVQFQVKTAKKKLGITKSSDFEKVSTNNHFVTSESLRSNGKVCISLSL